ncbi:beta-induced protein ig-h3 [Seminavis robusta]|uniref:Beta-induced protein ig-h3 n=1 Tax=Seminavis robusta TaxID=568900 RepID=A0A9N8E061_9STRA|nr:beta-induced protein ig-h3 [Seminavis robusta]|eukprot:Sro432_g141680.1 beta-induced protein ig-h3 (417) ;mRNA; r:44932-46259
MMNKSACLLVAAMAAVGLVSAMDVDAAGTKNLRASVASDASQGRRRLDEDGDFVIVETNGCEPNVARAKDFIAAAGQGELGSTECLADPVNGCPGGCCRIGSAYFICDSTGSESSFLPCVCNSLTAPPPNPVPPPVSAAAEAPTAAFVGDIVDIAIADNDFNTLVDLVATAGLVDTLKSPGPFTVFAPLDAAFPSGVELESFKNSTDLDTLISILTYHVVPGRVPAAAMFDGATLETVEGSVVTISLTNGTKVNDANIVMTDIEADNGIIHVIDAVLIPPPPPELDIVQTAIADGGFTTLVDLIATAGLVETLSGTGPFTVFAPNDVAFPQGEELVKFKEDTDMDTLAQILTFHVAPGIIRSSDLMDGAEVTTLEGSTVTVSLDDDGAMINGANVIVADIGTSNGIIHVIDSVLMP